MRLVVTIDVEEDQWGIVPHGQATAKNVYRLPRLQALLNEFGIIPTYLVTYPVMQDSYAVGILREIVEAGECEIGAHCHPWNTPPFNEPLSKRNSMLCNLPATLQYEKLQRLHEAIQLNVDRSPRAFRSGRWGFDTEVARNLLRLGYRIDTSVTPYTSWVQTAGPDFSCCSPQPYAFAPNVHTGHSWNEVLTEIPATIGYLHGEFQACATLADRLNRAPFGRFKVGGLLSHLRLLRKVWLSPEMETPARMMQLVRQMRHQQYEWLNLVFHSSALLEGCGPFVRSRGDEQAFLKRLRTFLCAAVKEGILCVSLSEAARYFVPASGEPAATPDSSSLMANCPAFSSRPFA